MAHFFCLWWLEMRQGAHKLAEMLAPVVQAMGYELLGIEFFPRKPSALLRVYIDQESGISVADCEKVSHQISGVLDVEDLIVGHYTLEVSSPGLDRPLFEVEHFVRFSGHKVRVQLAIPLSGRRNFVGRLLGVDNGEVVIDSEGEKVSLPLENIQKARLIPEF